MQTDEQAYLRGILEHPADDFRRLIFADHLEENGQADRCEFIRVQVALATTPEECSDCGGTGCPYCGGSGRDYHLSCTRCGSCENTGHNPRWEAIKRREQELLGQHGEQWAEPIATILGYKRWGNSGSTNGPLVSGASWHWSRGFVSGIELPYAAFLEHSARIFAVAPIEVVTLGDERIAIDLEDGKWTTQLQGSGRRPRAGYYSQETKHWPTRDHMRFGIGEWADRVIRSWGPVRAELPLPRRPLHA